MLEFISSISSERPYESSYESYEMPKITEILHNKTLNSDIIKHDMADSVRAGNEEFYRITQKYYKKLNSASTNSDVDAIFKEYNKVKSEFFDKYKVSEGIEYIKQKGVEAKVSAIDIPQIKKNTVVTDIVSDAGQIDEMSANICSSVNSDITSKISKTGSNNIQEEALKRTAQESTKSIKAQEAQKYFNGISDVTTGKSAEESAKIIEDSIQNNIQQEALKRTAQESTKSIKAQEAQKYFNGISDVTTGKSAEESAKVFVETGVGIKEKIKKTFDFIKEKSKALIKTKQFKYGVAISALIGLSAVVITSIDKHNKGKQNSKA